MEADPAFAAMREHAAEQLRVVAPTAAQPLIAAALAESRPVLAVTATNREAEDLVAALQSLMDDAVVAQFPSWETLPHERLSPGADIVGQRLSVIRRLVHPEDGHPVNVVVAPVRAILQPLVTKLAELQPVHLKAKDEANFDDIIRRLADAGYARVDIVEKRGQFAVRGGQIGRAHV